MLASYISSSESLLAISICMSDIILATHLKLFELWGVGVGVWVGILNIVDSSCDHFFVHWTLGCTIESLNANTSHVGPSICSKILTWFTVHILLARLYSLSRHPYSSSLLVSSICLFISLLSIFRCTNGQLLKNCSYTRYQCYVLFIDTDLC